MTGSLLSDQFWNIKLDSKSYSIENQCYVSMLALLYIDGYALGFQNWDYD